MIFLKYKYLPNIAWVILTLKICNVDLKCKSNQEFHFFFFLFSKHGNPNLKAFVVLESSEKLSRIFESPSIIWNKSQSKGLPKGGETPSLLGRDLEELYVGVKVKQN